MKNLFFMILAKTGLPALIRETVQKNKVTILLFHNINEEMAKQTFSYLSMNYNIIGLNDFIDAHKQKKAEKIPKKALIITFDDGHVGNHALLPIIKEYHIPVTIFLCASIINTNRHFWFLLDGLSQITSKIKSEGSEWYEDLSKYGYDTDKEYEYPQALQKNHIEEMKSHVDFQSHTLYHPILPRCRTNQARIEIFKSKEMLEKNYGMTINAIAYPNGDYSERDILLVKEAGYTCGVTVDYGYNSIKSDIFRLKRLSICSTDNIYEVIVKSCGLWAFVKTLNGIKQGHGLMNSIN